MLAGILRITGSVELKSAIRQEFGGRQLFFHDGLLLRLPPRRFMRTVRLSPYLQESIGFQEPFCASIERLMVACEMARAAEAAAASAIANDWRELLARHSAGAAFEPVDDPDNTPRRIALNEQPA